LRRSCSVSVRVSGWRRIQPATVRGEGGAIRAPARPSDLGPLRVPGGLSRRRASRVSPGWMVEGDGASESGQCGVLRQRHREGMEDQLRALGLAMNSVVLFNASASTPPSRSLLSPASPFATTCFCAAVTAFHPPVAPRSYGSYLRLRGGSANGPALSRSPSAGVAWAVPDGSMDPHDGKGAVPSRPGPQPPGRSPAWCRARPPPRPVPRHRLRQARCRSVRTAPGRSAVITSAPRASGMRISGAGGGRAAGRRRWTSPRRPGSRRKPYR
jgi:hypothetical protein